MQKSRRAARREGSHSAALGRQRQRTNAKPAWAIYAQPFLTYIRRDTLSFKANKNRGLKHRVRGGR